VSPSNGSQARTLAASVLNSVFQFPLCSLCYLLFNFSVLPSVRVVMAVGQVGCWRPKRIAAQTGSRQRSGLRISISPFALFATFCSISLCCLLFGLYHGRRAGWLSATRSGSQPRTVAANVLNSVFQSPFVLFATFCSISLCCLLFLLSNLL
jgi:hypothetical protein